MRKRPLLLIACIFLTGLVCQRYQILSLQVVPIGWFVLESYHGIKNKNLKIAAGRSIILLSAFILGMAHMYLEEMFRDTYMSKIVDGSRATIWGEIKKIETTDTSIRTILTDCYIRLNGEEIPCNDVLVYASSNHFQVGEIHQITGQIHNFEKPRNLGGFDSYTYYQSKKIDFYMYEDSSTCLEKEKNAITKWIFSFKGEIEQVYYECVDGKSAGFFSAMIIGNKVNLDGTIKDLFALGGISHILAISGLHVSMIGRGVYKILRKKRIGFFVAGVLSSVILLIYGFMVGNEMSAIRAIGMMLLYFLAQYLGRSYDMLNALGTICLLLLLENPFLIEYSGFWLSITALIGVGYIGSVFSDRVEKGKAFWSCVGITLSTLPVVACCYYEIPMYSSLVNMIVLPILTPLFCIALLAGVIGVWMTVVADLLLIPCVWILKGYEWICEFVQGLPFNSMITGCPSKLQVVVYYGVLLLATYVIQKRSSDEGKRRKAWIELTVLCTICFSIILFPKEHTFEITFLDVGQGDGVYISAGDGTNCFIDGGSIDVNALGEYHILPFLKYKGVREIDYWFVSHADADHISGLLELIESGYEIKHLVVAKESPQDTNFKDLINAAKNAQIPIVYMKVGDKILSEDMSITCLYPWHTMTEDRNNMSLVLQMKVNAPNMPDKKMTALFAGDISAEIEKELINKSELGQIDVFKVVHHGSKYSNSSEFIEVISPQIAVVSCGEKNAYGHPHEQIIERLESAGVKVLYTMKNGQVTITNMN